MVSIPVNENILLRTFQPEDAGALFTVIDKNRVRLRSWLSWIDHTRDENDVAAFIKDALIGLRNQDSLHLGIFYGRKIIGGLGMTEWSHKLRKAQTGYWIDLDFEGKGILSLCLEKFIDFLFSKINLNKVEISFVISNKRSAAVAQKLNAKTEAVIRDGYWRNGSFEDLVIAGILKREWESR